MTRDAAAVSTPKDAFGAKTVYGATFDSPHPARPGADRRRPRQADQAAPGRRDVGGTETNARVTTDAEGRYTLTGFPKE